MFHILYEFLPITFDLRLKTKAPTNAESFFEVNDKMAYEVIESLELNLTLKK